MNETNTDNNEEGVDMSDGSLNSSNKTEENHSYAPHGEETTHANEVDKEAEIHKYAQRNKKKKIKKVFKNIAKAISFLFFPLLIPVYGTFMLFSMKLFTYYPTPYIEKAKSTIIIFGVILPCIVFIALKLVKAISDVRLPKKEERLAPFICIAFCYLCCAYILFRCAMPLWVINLILSVTIVILIESIISIFWKISGHATSMGMLIGAIMVAGYHTYSNVNVTLIISLLIAGVVGTARMYLNRHTTGQIILGFLFGCACVILLSILNPGQIMRFIPN